MYDPLPSTPTRLRRLGYSSSSEIARNLGMLSANLTSFQKSGASGLRRDAHSQVTAPALHDTGLEGESRTGGICACILRGRYRSSDTYDKSKW